jgi:hypothetical protein
MGSDPPPSCTAGSNVAAAMARPPGVAAGEPYRWLRRSWRSPLGLTVRRYGLAIDGMPVFGRHQVEVHDARGALAYRAGSGDAVLAELRARGASAWAAWRHPRAGLDAQDRRTPLSHGAERAVWHYARGRLVAAVASERLDLAGATPVGEVVVRDAVTGAELARHSTLYEVADPEYLVYVRDDGRPLCSPLGDTLPHPTGVPDGKVPAPVAQRTRRQSQVAVALADPWLPASATQSRGNNVVAFFDSLLDRSGKVVDPFDDNGNDTPEYGPGPDVAGGDFFASLGDTGLAFPYDATKTAGEYFQDGVAGTATPAPDPKDPAINAKIVAAFYATNWLHDYFHAAGYDETAGNPQLSNLGRGGEPCDPLIVHAAFFTTFTFPGSEGVSPVMDLGLNARSASRRDSAVDFTVLAHEWGHTLIGRVAGGTAPDDGLGNLQGGALHEGIADFVAMLVNVSNVDPHATYAIGAYTNLDYVERRPTLPPGEAPADAMYYGIRRYPYSLDLANNPLTFQHIATPPPLSVPYYNWKGRGPLLSEVHTAGEVFAAGLFQCFGNIVAAHPGADFEQLRARMAQYLVAGLAAFPDHPSLLDARIALLDPIRMASPGDDYPACRAGFAARGMGADALGPDGEFGADDPSGFPPYDPAQVVESFLDQDRALRVTASTYAVDATDPSHGTIRVELRNTGLVDLADAQFAITAAVTGAAAFPGGAGVDVARQPVGHTASATLPVVVNACLLPAHPTQTGFRAFDYTVGGSSSDEPGLQHVATFHAAVPDPVAPCVAGP